MTTYEDRPDIIVGTVDGPDGRAGSDAEATGAAGAAGHGRSSGQHPSTARGGRSTRRPRRVTHGPSAVDPSSESSGGPADSAVGGSPTDGWSDGRLAGVAAGGTGSSGRAFASGRQQVSALDPAGLAPSGGAFGADHVAAADTADTDAADGSGAGALAPVRAALAAAGSCRASLLMAADHRTARPRVFTAPVDLAFAGQLLDLALEVADQAATAEWRPACPGFAPSSGQWLWTPTADTALDTLDEEVCRPTHPPYQRSVEFGRSSLLVLRVRADDGAEVLRLYQGFSPDKALGTGRRLVAFWSGERFSGLTEPLVVDRSFRVIVAHGVAVMPTAASYEGLFGPPTALRAEAAAIFTETFEDALAVRGIDELRAACLSDLNMMRKLVSIRRRLADPRFRAALTMDRIMAFLAANPQITVPIDRSGPTPALVFEPGPQQRWALLKLLDDDYLRSDLTDYRYEANSKSEVR